MKKGILLRKCANDVQVIKVKGIKDYYRFIGCESIDIVCYSIGGKYYDIIVDDEFLFADQLITTVCDRRGKNMIFGNIIILGDGSETGDSPSLTADDIKNIREHLYPVVYGDGSHGKVVVVDGYTM